VGRIETTAFTGISAVGIEERQASVVGNFTVPLARRARLGRGFCLGARRIAAGFRSGRLTADVRVGLWSASTSLPVRRSGGYVEH
jgi:hypothetical protein